MAEKPQKPTWNTIPTDLTDIHYTRIYSKFRYWEATGSLAKIFENTVVVLNKRGLLDMSVVHGDGTTDTLYQYYEIPDQSVLFIHEKAVFEGLKV
jgi:hypothetical protein